MFRPFASCIRTFVDSRTCETLPGADDTSSLYIVWIESITTTSGVSFSITLCIVARFVSHRRYRLSENSPIRFARSLICFKDSSPDIYRTFFFIAASFWQTCNNRVDLPIPGSPPTNTREPCTIPPPNTLSNSLIPVFVRSSSVVNTLDRVTIWLFGFATLLPLKIPPAVVTTFSSTNVFHSLHIGHCPSHLLSSCPQF